MKYLIKCMMIIGILGVFVGFKVQVNAAVQYETENNDSYERADIITPGNIIKGNVSNGDEDYYKITAPANGKLELTFQHKYQDSNSSWEISIYQDTGTEPYVELSNQEISLEDNESITLPFIGAIKSETYFLKIRDKRNMDGEEYTIQTSFTSSEFYEKEQNNDYYSANDVVLNNKYTGTINNGDDADYYKIVAPEDGKISLNFQHRYKDIDKKWNINIYQYVNGQYNEMSSWDISLEDNENVSLPFIGAVKNGVYYLKVSGRTVVGESYTIQTAFDLSDIYEKEPNDDYYSATNISLNKKYSGNLNNGNDKDYYHFVAPASGTLCLDFQHTYKDDRDGWYINAYNYIEGEYKEVDGIEVRQNDANIIKSLEIQVVKGRKYYIIVEDNGGFFIADDAVGKEYFVNVYMKPKEVKVSKIQLSCSSKKIAAGNKVRIKASVSPSNATNKGIIWSSSNSKVAKVNQKGVVTFKKNSGGKSVTITATASDGSGAKASIKLKSMRGEVKKIIIKGKKKVKAGKSCKLRAKVKATKGANTRIKWSSSNTKYATVSSSGKVKAKKAGKGKIVKITARATDGSGKTKTVKIKIK